MMSDVRRVVFLIHANISSSNTDFENKEKSIQWQQIVHTALKILTQFNSATETSLNWSENGSSFTPTEITKNLQWGYKFVQKSKFKFHTSTDLKSLTEENFASFQEELKYNEEDENKADFFAHTLADNLITVAHDFKWEQHDIISPVKQARKKGFYVNRKRNRLSGHINNFLENNGKNFIFIIGPLPKTKEELNTYFEWNISDVNDITKVLMPSQVATHFRDKHDIRLFWVDSAPDYNKGLYSPEENIFQGKYLMDQFINVNNGCVIPISLSEKNNFNEKNLRTRCLSSQHKLLSKTSETNRINNTVLNDSVFENKNNFNRFCNISKYSIIANQIKNKNADLSKLKLNCFLTYQYEDIYSFLLNFTQISLRTTNLKPFILFHNLTNQSWKNYCSEVNFKIQRSINYHSNCFLNFKVPQVNIEMPEILPNTENINFVVLGYQYAHVLPMFRFNGLNLIGGQQFNSKAFRSIVDKAHEENKVYIVRSHCTLCGPSLQQCCCVHVRIGIFQSVTSESAAISWIIEPQRNNLAILMASCQKFQPQLIDLGMFLPICYNEFSRSKLKESINKEKYLTQCFGEFVPFEPEMMDAWFLTANSSSQFQQLCSDVKSDTFMKEAENGSNFLEFSAFIISQLQSEYKAIPNDKSKEKLNTEKKFYKPAELPNYDSKLAIEAAMFEYQSTLGRFYNEPLMMKSSAHEIIHSFCRLSDEKSTVSFDKVEDLLIKNIFVSVAEIRKKNEIQEKKTAEYFMQILLKFEWLYYKLPLREDQDEFILEESEIIIDLLRSISISESPEQMTKFLSEVVESYPSCGRVLYEIHSDLMLPIPSSLEQYSLEAGVDDCFFDPFSNKSDLPSMGPFSMATSVESHCSDNLRPSKQFKLRRTSHISSTVTRNIFVPEPKKTANRQKQKMVDTSKSRFQLSTRNKLLPENKSQPQTETKLAKHVSQEVIKVRRDLFAKSAQKNPKTHTDLIQLKKNTKTDIEWEHSENSRKGVLSVVDTPVAKQRMTALARQKFRMKRSHDNELVGEVLTVIGESPMKFENDAEQRQSDSVITTQPKSPRHSVMLNRRHSFYRGNDSKSRTVARAEVVQQHHLAHPPTPRITHPKRATTKSLCLSKTFSPKSLLFSYSSQKSGKTFSGAKKCPPQKGRRRLQLVNSDETPKFLYQKCVSPNKITDSNIKKSISKSQNTTCIAKTPLCINKPPLPGSKNEKKTTELVTPVNSSNKSLQSLPPLIKQSGPLDNYITRTPTPEKQGKLTATVCSKRKLSPNGNHIHCWPRRKRPVKSYSSPVFLAKQIKIESGSKSPLFFNIDNIIPTENNSLKGNKLDESPDHGMYIVSDGNNSNQKISKLLPDSGNISPGIHVEQYLLNEVGVFPITESQNLQTLTRIKHREGTLFHNSVGSPNSKKHVPMMFLCNNLNENND